MAMSSISLPFLLERPGVLQHRCNYCKTSGSELITCAGCGVVQYCCPTHQAADRSQHAWSCKQITETRTKATAYKYAIQNPNTVVGTLGNATGDRASHYSGFTAFQYYLEEGHHLADLLWKTGTLEGIREALSLSRSMLLRIFSSQRGLYRTIPLLMLHVNEDQECYDFIRWHLEDSHRRKQRWMIVPGNPNELGWLSEITQRPDFKDPDLMEAVNLINYGNPETSHIIAILLILNKLLIDMHNIKTVRRLCTRHGQLPIELTMMIEEAVIVSPVSKAWYDQARAKTMNEFRRRTSILEAHIPKFGLFVHENASSFWKLLLDPSHDIESVVDGLPPIYKDSSIKHAQELWHHTCFAWYQAEGVIPAMRRAQKMSRNQGDMCAMWSNFANALVV